MIAETEHGKFVLATRSQIHCEKALHPAAIPIPELLKQTTEKRLRRGGPGGQHRNKVETAVLLQHTPTGVAAEAAERRSQQQNRVVAVQRLRINLALEVRSPSGPNQCSELWRSRIKGGKLAINSQHEDMPALLAEALDQIVATDHDMKQAATNLQISTSQLIKFLKLEPRALGWVNQVRQTRGQGALR